MLVPDKKAHVIFIDRKTSPAGGTTGQGLGYKPSFNISYDIERYVQISSCLNCHFDSVSLTHSQQKEINSLFNHPPGKSTCKCVTK